MDKKFTESVKIEDYEILTDDGFKEVIYLHKTINYEVYNLILNNKELKCADFHTVFLENGDEIYVKNLEPFDKIKTIDGVETVIKVEQLGYEKEMWDFELSGENCKYYTNGVLSHNTFLIRHLLQRLAKTNKKVLYFPPSMVEAVTDPTFFNFITSWTMDNGKNSILLIEDAEPLLSSRESTRNMGITNLLNLTDGILNDILSIQIIATFNTNLNDLDKALLRPERLIARKEFGKLTIENGKKLAEILKIDPDLIKDEMTLADIYSIKNDNEVLLHGVDTEKKKTIGFR